MPGWNGGEEFGIRRNSGCAELPVKLPSSERDSAKVPFCLLWVNRARETFIIDRVYTCRGLVGLSNYLLDRHGDLIQYVLLGKIQSDKIEGHFGHLRKLAGGNYWASVRQFMEGEAVIRAKSLIQLSGYSLHGISNAMGSARRQRQLDDAEVAEELLETASLDVPLHLDEGTEQAIGHLAGYLVRSALKKHKCDACHSQLVCDVPSEVIAIRLESMETKDHSNEAQEALRSFCDILNRGKLIFPSDTTLLLTKNVCHIYRQIMRDDASRYALFGCANPRGVFQSRKSKLQLI